VTPSGPRYYAGWFFFVMSVTLPLGAFFVPMLGLDKATSALVTGALLVGAPEIGIVLAVAFWGKETFNYFMGRIKDWFKQFAPPPTVSPRRYYTGLVLLAGSFLPTWILAYAPQLLSDAARIPVLVSADLIFVASFFVLGGEFWGKVRALFTP
jgi:hypothetical protein